MLPYTMLTVRQDLAGILPSTWPLPLNRRGMYSALVPATQAQGSLAVAIGQPASPKRHAEADLYEVGLS